MCGLIDVQQTYMQRKSGKDKEDGKEGVQPEDKNEGKDKAIVPPPKQTESRTYQPSKFKELIE